MLKMYALEQNIKLLAVTQSKSKTTITRACTLSSTILLLNIMGHDMVFM